MSSDAKCLRLGLLLQFGEPPSQRGHIVCPGLHILLSGAQEDMASTGRVFRDLLL